MTFFIRSCPVLTRNLLFKRVCCQGDGSFSGHQCLNFSSGYFRCFCKFDNFVTHVLSHRNHQIEVTSVKLHFQGELNQCFHCLVKKMASYAFSHNVQELVIVVHSDQYLYNPCLVSSKSLKHCTLTCIDMQLCGTPKIPFDFPALTTLNLSQITLGGEAISKCVNLKNLTLERLFVVHGPEDVFDISAPRLSSLMLISGRCLKTINLIAPQLENLTIIDCSIGRLNAPSGLSSFCYTYQFMWLDGFVQFSNDRFHSLNKVTICLSIYKPYEEEDARKTINMLQELHSARYLTLNVDAVECISSFPKRLSQHSSPFSKLICLTIDYSMREDAYETTMSREAKTFFLESSPNATLIMKLPNQGSK